MAQCKQNAQEFVQNTFNPHVAVLCSPDAEVLCQKNNLTFVELVQPFCRLTSEGDHVFIIEDSVTDILYCTIAGILARIWLMFYQSCKTSRSGRTGPSCNLSESSSLSNNTFKIILHCIGAQPFVTHIMINVSTYHIIEIN